MVGVAHRSGFDLSYAVGVRVAYALDPGLHLELFGAYVRPGGQLEALRSNLQIRTDQTYALRTELLWAAGFSAWWRPIYGALAFDEWVVGRFRVELGVGIAVGETRAPCINGLALDPNRGFPENADGEVVCNPTDASPIGMAAQYYEPNLLRPIGQFGAAFEADLLELVALRLELRDLVFASRVYRPSEAPTLDDALAHWLFVQVGVGFIF